MHLLHHTLATMDFLNSSIQNKNVRLGIIGLIPNLQYPPPGIWSDPSSDCLVCPSQLPSPNSIPGPSESEEPSGVQKDSKYEGAIQYLRIFQCLVNYKVYECGNLMETWLYLHFLLCSPGYMSPFLSGLFSPTVVFFKS